MKTLPIKKRSEKARRPGTFKPGHKGGPGRPAGVPNKATIAGRAFCQGLVDNPKYRAWFKREWEKGLVSDTMQQMVWAYAIGRPSAAPEDNAAGGSLLELLQRVHRGEA